MNAYVVEHLTKIYRGAERPANADITLSVREGEIFGVFGPNGAGKTTLVRQMVGLLKPTEGRISLFGHDVIRDPATVPWLVGYYGQRLVALGNHTFYEVLHITGILRGLADQVAKQEALLLIDRFGAERLAPRRLGSLSGGEQRLAVLLGTMVGSPRALILDEPTSELDPVRRRGVWQLLSELSQGRGTTIVLVTHNLLEAEQAVQQVAIIDEGRVQAVGTPGTLKRAVADLVRLEIQLRDGASDGTEERLRQIPGSEKLRPGRWQITAVKAEAATLLPRIIGIIGLEVIDDFRLITPTMEDVYVHITGRTWRDGGRTDSAAN